MSFSKAKLHRFNEVAGCAPPPGTYQPKWGEKPILGTMGKSERFCERKNSDGTLDLSRSCTPKIEKKVRHKLFSDMKLKQISRIDTLDTSSNTVKDDPPTKEIEHAHCICVSRANVSTSKCVSKVREMTENSTRSVARLNGILSKLEGSGPILDHLREELIFYRSNTLAMRSTYSELTDRSSSLQELNIDYQIKIAKLQDEIDCLTTEKNEACMEYRKYKSKGGEIEDELEKLKVKAAEMENTRVSELEVKTTLQRKIESLQLEMKERSCTINVLREKLDLADNKIISLEKRNVELEKSVARAEEANEDAERRFESEKVAILTGHKSVIDQLQEKLDLKSTEVISLTEKSLNLESSLTKTNKIQTEEKAFFELKVSNLEKIWSDKIKFVERQLESEMKKVKDLKMEFGSTEARLKLEEENRDKIEAELLNVTNCLNDARRQIKDSVQEGDVTLSVFMQKIILALKSVGYELPAVVEDNKHILVEVITTAIKSQAGCDEANQLRRELEARELCIHDLKKLIGPFREQLELYEQERVTLQNLNLQTKDQLEQLALQHAAALGHQNHKQKIKHLVKLKEHNFKLQEENDILRNKLRQKERLMAKYTKEKSTASPNVLQLSGKENSSRE